MLSVTLSIFGLPDGERYVVSEGARPPPFPLWLQPPSYGPENRPKISEHEFIFRIRELRCQLNSLYRQIGALSEQIEDLSFVLLGYEIVD